MEPGDRAVYVGKSQVALPQYSAGVFWGSEREPREMDGRVEFEAYNGAYVALEERFLRPEHGHGDTEDWPI